MKPQTANHACRSEAGPLWPSALPRVESWRERKVGRVRRYHGKPSSDSDRPVKGVSDGDCDPLAGTVPPDLPGADGIFEGNRQDVEGGQVFSGSITLVTR